MKKALLAAAAIVALPVMAQAQSPSPGVYIGAEGGLNWLLNFNATPNSPDSRQCVSDADRRAGLAGGVIGYDFVGPRVELEGIYRKNSTNVGLPGTALNNQVGQLGIMANLMYDFMPASVITPYIGAGAGLGLVDSNTLAGQHGVCLSGHRRPGLDRRHELPREPRWPLLRHVEPDGQRRPVDQQQLQRDAGSAAEVRLGSAAAAGSAAAGVAPPSFMVFFDWDRSNLSQQALNTIKQAAGCVQEQGQRPHHGDRPHRHVGPGSLQHGAVAASRQRGQGRPGA